MLIQNETLEFKLAELHPAQQQIAVCSAPRIRAACGRQFGKSKMCCSIGSGRALAYQTPIWWCAPTYRNTKDAWRELWALAQQIKRYVKIYIDDFLIEYPGGGYVQVVSAASPENLRGAGLGGLILDEAAFAPREVYDEVLTPMLLVRDGWDIHISTPNGFNWFHEEYQRGNAGNPQYAAFHFTTYDNPYIKREVIDRLKTTMTEKAFRQEILAEFVADALSVFRNVDGCIYHDPEAHPLPGHEYVMGVDWGRKHDYTALSVWNATEGREVQMDYFSQVGFALQAGRVEALAQAWGVTSILAEENGIGMANVERLQDMGLPVTPFKMQTASKKLLVEAMALATERGEIGLVDDAYANGQMKAFAEELTPSGNIRYAAPAGGHDDCVIARCLAYSMLNTGVIEPVFFDWN